MSKFIGQLVNLGIGRETTHGTTVAATHWLARTALTFDDRAEQAVAMQSLGIIDDATDAFVTQVRGEGTVEGYIRDKSFGLLLYSMLGSLSTSGANPYTHTFTMLQSNQHPSLTFYVDDPNQDYRFPLVMLSKMTIDVKLGELVSFAADFISRRSIPDSVSKSYAAENYFTAKHAHVKIATALTGLAAATELAVKGFKIEVMKNLLPEQDLGTVSLADIHNQSFAVEGEFELLYEDQTFRNYMMDGSTRSLRLQLSNTDVDLGGGVNPSLTIDLSKVYFFDWEQDRTNDKIVSQKVKFKALYDITNAKNIIDSAILINAQASY